MESERYTMYQVHTKCFQHKKILAVWSGSSRLNSPCGLGFIVTRDS